MFLSVILIKLFCALLFCRSKAVEILHLENSESFTNLSKIQTLHMPEEPWDVCFDDYSLLWLLQPMEGETICLYTTTANNQV